MKKTTIGAVPAMVLTLMTTAFIAEPTSGGNRAASQLNDLSSVEQLKKNFQEDSGKVRLIALVSPVCPMCRKGFADMQTVLKDIPDNRIRAYIVWLPMFPGDSRSWAQTRADEFKDDRVTYYWDGDLLAGKEWRKVLGLDRTAWDVYFLYDAENKWDKETPAPSFWMHQLGGVTRAPQLNTTDFEAKLKELLAAVK